MSMPSEGRPSRRAILTGALGGIVALAAQAVGRPLPADGANGETVKVGGSFSGGATSLTNASGAAIQGFNTGGSGKPGVFGQTSTSDGKGVTGKATSSGGAAFGVFGQSASSGGAGVLGTGVRGVQGRSAGTAGRGVFGQATATTGDARGVAGVTASSSGTGASGFATAASGVTTGVLGEVSSPDGIGVVGTNDSASGFTIGISGDTASPDGIGVRGIVGGTGAGSGIGVLGSSIRDSGIGVNGVAGGTVGIGGKFEASTAAGSFGLLVLGRTEFSTCGVATIAAGNHLKVVTPGVELTSNSKILATLQSSAGSDSIVVSRVVPDTGANTFTIVLSADAINGCTVAWFVIG
jgi:collagen type VII alpha